MPEQKLNPELLNQDNAEKRGGATGSATVRADADQLLKAVINASRQSLVPTAPRVELSIARSSNLVASNWAPPRIRVARSLDGLTAEEAAAFALLPALLVPLEAFTNTGETVQPAVASDIEKMFPLRTETQLECGRKAVENDLRLHRAFDEDARESSVWEKLQIAGLSQDQLRIVLNAAAYVRENFANHRSSDGTIDSDQKSNWLHTMDEIDEILESAKDLDARETVHALMSMFGDAVKNKRNFCVHHLDGSHAWRVVASRLNASFNEEEIHRISEANKEHQIGPPELMARIYTSSIKASLNAERGRTLATLSTKTFGEMSRQERQQLLFIAGLKQAYDNRNEELHTLQASPDLCDEDQSRMETLMSRQLEGPFVSDEESSAIAGIYHKIANPFSVDLVDTPSGGKTVQFTQKEGELFARTGNEFWHVPHQSTGWYRQSRIGIDADSKANYARVGGFRKLLHLNGPESDTFFQFSTLENCLQSPRCSYEQAAEIMTLEGRLQAIARLSETDAAIARAKESTEEWLRAELNLSADEPMPPVPFWNVELLYPDRGEYEQEWWRINKLPESEREPAEQTLWLEHRFDGLDDSQRTDYLRAIRIRDFMVDQLAREQRLDGSVPDDFPAVMDND